MKEELLEKIEEAEKTLGYVFPAAIRNLLLSLEDYGFYFGKEEWFFDVYNDRDKNTIVEDSLLFKEDWGLDAIVFARNAVGDYLLLLPKLYPKKMEGQLDDIIYVMWHELGELRIFAYDVAEAVDEDFETGPVGDEFVFRLTDDDILEEGFELRRIYDPVAYVEYLKMKFPVSPEIKAEGDGEGEEWLQKHEQLNQVSEWINEERGDKIDEIQNFLNECLTDEFLGPRAHWLLSKLYLKGIGLPVDTKKSIEHLHASAARGNYSAMADLSFYYQNGIGVQMSSLKAIEWMELANEKSEGLFAEKLEMLKSLQAQKN